jgi:hypothetical protein
VWFITPNNILTINSLNDFRLYTLQNFSNIKFVNIRGNVFEDANVDTMIACMKKNSAWKDISILENINQDFIELCTINKSDLLVGDIIS